ncbi:MAG: peptidylprolyl isomerase [Planctomycetota bacterium]|jgi:cyclophilin family peptidyl-prolyl cis-trans isomerase/Tfp pilus assembly protein PilF
MNRLKANSLLTAALLAAAILFALPFPVSAGEEGKVAPPPKISIPSGKAPSFDGKISPGEYVGARTITVPLAGNTKAEIHALVSGGWLFVGYDIGQPYEFVNEVQFLWSRDGETIETFGFNPFFFFNQPRYIEEVALAGEPGSAPVENPGGWRARATADSKRGWQAEVQISLARLGVKGGTSESCRAGFIAVGISRDTTAIYPNAIAETGDIKSALAEISPSGKWPAAEKIAASEKEAESFSCEFELDAKFRGYCESIQGLAMVGNFEQIFKSIEEMEKLLPGTPAVPYFRGLMHVRSSRNFKGAVSDFREAIKRSPGLHNAYREIVNVFLTQVKDNTAARKEIEKYIAEFPNDTRPLLFAAPVFEELKDPAAARAALEKAYVMRRDDVEILKRLVAGYLEEGTPEMEAKSLKLLDAHIAAYPEKASAQAERALILAQRLYRFADAAAAMEKAIALEPEDVSLRIYRAQFLFWEGKYEEAAKILDKIAARLTAPALRNFATGLLHASRVYPLQAKKELKRREVETEKDDLPRVKLVTSRGEITLELFEDDAPNTVANFISLVESGFYNGTEFHQVIHGAYAQGGDPNSRDDDPNNDGFGGPGYRVRDEKSPRRHFRGTITMARGREPNSAGSQFLITLVTLPEIDGKNASFGRVISGMEILGRLRKGDKLIRAEVIRKREHEYRPEKFEGPLKSDPFWEKKKNK